MRAFLVFSTLFSIFSAIALLSSPAHADEGKVSSILYTCNLTFKANGSSTYLGVGYTEIDGSGSITCYDILTGQTQRIPVKVRAHGPGVGLGRTGVTMAGAASGVGITKGPESLLGRYGVVRANAAVGVGAAGSVGFKVAKEAVTVDVSVQAQTGLGAGVDLLWIDLEREGATVVEAPAAPVAAPVAVAVAPPPAVVAPAPRVMSSTNTIYLAPGQPLEIVDAQGRVLQTIYVKTR